MIDFANETLQYATSISLGKDSDDDRRPYVSVARQYGTTRPWVVYDVDREHGVDHDSKAEFDDQREAIAFGWQQLSRIRRVCGDPGSLPT